MELVGYKKGDNQHSATCTTLSQQDIAKELGMSTDELKRILKLEKDLLPELKQALDKGFISTQNPLISP